MTLDASSPACDHACMWIKTKRKIAEAFANLKEGDRVEVQFKPITDPVWIKMSDGVPCIHDAADEPLWSGLLADVVAGRAVTTTIDEIGDTVRARVERPIESEQIENVVLTADHIARMHVLPSPKPVAVEGLEWPLVLHPEGHAVVGCQTITREGCEQAFRALAEHLGYEVTD